MPPRKTRDGRARQQRRATYHRATCEAASGGSGRFEGPPLPLVAPPRCGSRASLLAPSLCTCARKPAHVQVSVGAAVSDGGPRGSSAQHPTVAARGMDAARACGAHAHAARPRDGAAPAPRVCNPRPQGHEAAAHRDARARPLSAARTYTPPAAPPSKRAPCARRPSTRQRAPRRSARAAARRARAPSRPGGRSWPGGCRAAGGGRRGGGARFVESGGGLGPGRAAGGAAAAHVTLVYGKAGPKRATPKTALAAPTFAPLAPQGLRPDPACAPRAALVAVRPAAAARLTARSPQRRRP